MLSEAYQLSEPPKAVLHSASTALCGNKLKLCLLRREWGCALASEMMTKVVRKSKCSLISTSVGLSYSCLLSFAWKLIKLCS